MAMLGGGEGFKEQCRTVDIMSDAAYAILTRDSKTFTGNFVIDDEILKSDGCTDFEKYSCVKGAYWYDHLTTTPSSLQLSPWRRII